MENVASWGNLYRIEVFRHSWLPASLKGTSSRTKALIMIWAVFGVVPAVVFSIAAWLEGSFFLEPDASLYLECAALELVECDARGFLEDIMSLSLFVPGPVLLSAMAIVFPKLPEVIFTLRGVISQAPPSEPDMLDTKEPSTIYPRRLSESSSRSALPANDDGPRLKAKEFNEMLKRHEETILGKTKSKYLAIGLFVLYMAVVGMGASNNWFALQAYGYDTWGSKNHMAGFVAWTTYTAIVLGAVLSFLTFKFIMITHVLRSICVELTANGWIRVRPMSPDKAGGLGALGTFSLQMVMILAVVLAPAAAAVYSGVLNLVFMISISVYIPLLVFAFFYPLSGAHKAMGTAKKETLRILSRQFNRIYDDFMIDMKSNKPRTLKADFELADNVDKLYVKAQQMPVWPFNLVTLGRFGGVLLTVTLTVWLKFIIGWFSGFG